MDEQNPYATQGDAPDYNRPHAPPTAPGELQPPQSKWPMVFGVISIVFGAIGLTCTCAGLAMIPFANQMAQQAQAQGGGTAGAQVSFTGPIWWYIPSSLITIALSALLLIAGIALVRRRPIGVTLHLWWAIAKIAWSIIGTVASIVIVTLPMMQAQGQNAAAQGGGAGAAAAMGGAFGIIGGVVGVLIAVAYPIVVIVWMRRPAVRAEIARWA